MTKEELEKEAIAKYKTGSYPQLHPDYWAFVHGYLAGAEPREKRIADLEQQNKELTLKISGLESDCDAYNYSQRTYQEEIKELKAQIEKMKCCGNCKQRELIRERGQWKERFNCKGNRCVCYSKWEIKEK